MSIVDFASDVLLVGWGLVVNLGLSGFVEAIMGRIIQTENIAVRFGLSVAEYFLYATMAPRAVDLLFRIEEMDIRTAIVLGIALIPFHLTRANQTFAAVYKSYAVIE